MAAADALPDDGAPIRTPDAAATEGVGAEIAARLRPGDVVLLRGDLGAGKTTLVRGAARALGATARVTSPTFALAHRYDGGRVAVAHLDLYRLIGAPAPEDLLDEIPADAVAFVEWPQPLADELDDRVALEVELRHDGEDRREVRLAWR